MPPFPKLAIVVFVCLTIPSAGLVVEELDYYDESEDYSQSQFPGFSLPTIKLPVIPVPSLGAVTSLIPEVPVPGANKLVIAAAGAVDGAVDGTVNGAVAGATGAVNVAAAGAVAGVSAGITVVERKLMMAKMMLALGPRIVAALAALDVKIIVKLLCTAAMKLAVGETLADIKALPDPSAKAVCKALEPDVVSVMTDLLTSEPSTAAAGLLAVPVVTPALMKAFQATCVPQLDKVVKAAGDAVTAVPKIIEFFDKGFCNQMSSSMSSAVKGGKGRKS